jgi:PAS domain S-box-containing protein
LTEELPNIKVLLIEDNQVDVATIKNSLTNRTFAEFEVDVAESPHDGLWRLDKSEYDVVLLDTILSGIDSLGLISQIRDKADVPIVALTSTDNKARALEAIRRGAQDYLVKGKPSDESLCRVLCYAVERRRFQKLVSETQRDANEARSNLELALRASNVAIWHCDIASDKLTWSEGSQNIFGLKPEIEHFTFKEFLALVHPDDRERAKHAARDSIRTKDIYDVEYRIVLSDGSIRNFVSKGRTFFDESGKAVRMAGICADITKHKMEEENAKRLALLEEREEFVATLTHDLKNPLIGIRRVVEIICERQLGPLSQDQSNALLQIKDTSDRLLFMIQNLIEAYRFEKESQTITMQRTDLLNLLKSSIDAVSPIAIDRQIVISSQLPAFPVELHADTGAIHRLFQNLLDNALKYTASGGNISVSVTTQDSSVVIEVSDNGVGISAKDQKRLFERFRRGSAGKKFTSGSGLGLYLCKQIVDAHCGQIDVTSIEGIGTKFKVTLPIHTKQAAMGVRQLV